MPGRRRSRCCPKLRRTPQALPDAILRAGEIVERGEDQQHRRLGHADDVFLGLRIADDHRLFGGGRDIDAVAISEDGSLIAAGDHGGGYTVWDTSTGARPKAATWTP